MNSPLWMIALGLVASIHGATIRVESNADLRRAAVVAADPAEKGAFRIELAGREFVLDDTFRILRSNVRLIGKPGARLVLGNHVEKPVIAVGVQDEIPQKSQRIHRIRIS